MRENHIRQFKESAGSSQHLANKTMSLCSCVEINLK